MVIDENDLSEVEAEDALRIGAALMRHADERLREKTGLSARI